MCLLTGFWASEQDLHEKPHILQNHNETGVGAFRGHSTAEPAQRQREASGNHWPEVAEARRPPLLWCISSECSYLPPRAFLNVRDPHAMPGLFISDFERISANLLSF